MAGCTWWEEPPRSAPAFAGLMAIVNQYTGGRMGNPNTRFYSLATQVPAAFHDVTTGSIAVPCAGGIARLLHAGAAEQRGRTTRLCRWCGL